jgi:GNAT superfamily N-acetyltransferase
MPPVVLRETELPVESMSALVDAAGKEGHSFVMRLLRDWQTGDNRFRQRGELFLVAWDKSEIVGVLGLNQDPFAKDASIGRLRHLYVRPSHRGQGVGSELCRRALALAPKTFNVVRLRTPDNRPRAFYERLGFIKVFGDPKATYALIFKKT